MTRLLAQVRRGERAFERFYRRHVGDVYRYALVVLRSPDAAEEVTRTTFVHAYHAFRLGERPRNSRAWLLALAHGICRQHVREAADEPIDLDHDFSAHAEPDEVPSSPTEIRRALAHLPFSQRSALVMRELEGRSYADIAQVLELSAAEVETLVFEGRRALREQLEGALTCHQAERAISRQIDGRLSRSERSQLRRHLGECDECAGFARSQRAQRPAWKMLARVQLPASLKSFFGPGGVMDKAGGAGAGIAVVGALAKTLAIAASGASAVGLAYGQLGGETARTTAPPVAEHRASSTPAKPAARRTVARAPRRATTDVAAKRTAPESPAPTPPTLRSQPQESRTEASPMPARSQAFQVRARATTKPVGHTQRAAAPRAETPAQPAPRETVAGNQASPPPTAPEPPAVPHLPTIPPLPLSLPPPPKLP
jgi:RNA polymerase sigma factor (sigma-70 family)